MSLAPDTVIVLDRDGVINADSPDYIKSPDEWHPLPGSLGAIARLTEAGLRVAVATNQSGLARGLFDAEALAAIHGRMLTAINAAGGDLHRIFFCPHGPDDGCDCRKPAPGLLLQAAEHFACGFDRMIVIGDSERDLAAALAVGATPVLVRTGNGKKTEAAVADKTDYAGLPVYDDLNAAVQGLLAEERRVGVFELPA